MRCGTVQVRACEGDVAAPCRIQARGGVRLRAKAVHRLGHGAEQALQRLVLGGAEQLFVIGEVPVGRGRGDADQAGGRAHGHRLGSAGFRELAGGMYEGIAQVAVVISRIKELHDRAVATEAAVVEGLARTGRLVTTAAALISISFLAFTTSDVRFIQFFGLGAGLAILIDATLVRGVLVPVAMRLLGRAAWFAPRPLRLVHARLGLAEA
jgi:hypothetical protein